MKKLFIKIMISVLLLGAVSSLRGVKAMAGELWSEAYYRVNDSLDSLSDAEKEALDEFCLDFMQKNEVDLALLSVLPGEHEDKSLAELAEGYYTDSEYGYGEDKSCIVFICDMSLREADYVLLGGAKGLVDKTYLDFAAESSMEFYDANGMYGVLYSGGKFISNYFDGSNGDGLPRIVDKADLFTDKEEQAMEERLSGIRNETGNDIVVVTDVSSGGKEKQDYADDYFDYNGYGFGEEREGALLFICMDPGDRGFWVSASGAETMRLYTYYIADQMDDVLQGYLKAGNYSGGVANWIENFYMLYTTGNPFTPAWLANADNKERFHDPEAERIDDEVGILNEKQLSELEGMAKEISSETDLDIVVHYTRDTGGMDLAEYAEKYFRYKGYGYGEDYDGIALVSLIHNGYSSDAVIYTFGRGNEKLTEVNYKRLKGFYQGKVDRYSISNGDPELTAGKHFVSIETYLKKLSSMEKTGRVPRSIAYWICITVFGTISGAIFGGVSLAGAESNMASPTEKAAADYYLISGSLNINGDDRYINTTKQSRYSPPKETRSGGSSGEHSSYSGGHTSSSGRSHSGSGRSF